MINGTEMLSNTLTLLTVLTCRLLIQLRLAFLLDLLNDSLVILLQKHTGVFRIIISNKMKTTCVLLVYQSGIQLLINFQRDSHKYTLFTQLKVRGKTEGPLQDNQGSFLGSIPSD